MVPGGNLAKHLPSVNRITKTIHRFYSLSSSPKNSKSASPPFLTFKNFQASPAEEAGRGTL